MRQVELNFKGSGWGGRRPGAGRPRKAGSGITHRRRPVLASRFPVHVTMRMRKGTYSLRSRRCFRVIEKSFWKGQGRFGMRLCHFSVQGNHLHLIVEAPDRVALSRAMKGLAVRMAKGLNQLMQRRGQVIGDRHHAHILRTPTEVRHAVQYVLTNHLHHFKRGPVDEYTSLKHPQLIVLPHTWLLQFGPSNPKPNRPPIRRVHEPPARGGGPRRSQSNRTASPHHN